MRSSEEMAYVLYLADCKESGIGTPDSSVQPRSWEQLDYEEEQRRYLGYVDALMRYLFEHGRISAYLSSERLDELSKEYRAYLKAKNG